LLRELLQQTQADVYCLVRAADAEAGRRKIQGNFESYLLWQPSFGSRITPIVGDLAQPYLGLPTQQFQTLARQIDAIYHCGAMVNFVYPYDKLKPVNVLGTQEVLRLATQAQAITVHYISTLSVFNALSYHPRDDNGRNDRFIREEAELSHSQNLRGGYAQSKWVAEKLVAEARTRGLPVCIYRLGTVAGDSQTGVWNANDYVCRFIRGCIQLGSIPDQDEAWHLAPVDYVGEAIVHLSRQPTSLGKTFHVFSPYRLHTSQLADWIRAFGYECRQLSHKQWLTEEEPRFDSQNLLDGLTGTEIVCPPIDAKLLAAYLSYFVRTGSLDAPPPGRKLEHTKT